MSDPYNWVQKSLNTLHKASWYRNVQTVEGRGGPVIEMEGRRLINLASNDYLGFASDQRLVNQAIEALQIYGTGATGSRLLSGHRTLHRQLETAIARLKGTEDAIVFSSGYLANIGTVAALMSPRDLILSDEYNHASLKSGSVLSGAKVITYRHCDMEHLIAQLAENRTAYRRCLILTDGVFGMDGDVCPLPEILAIADEFEAMVMIDEAHSVGVLGETGAGCVEYFGCGDVTVVQMGTLSKAFASLGGYIAGRRSLIEFLRNRAASWIYTTGLSPAETAAALGAIALLQQHPERLSQLHKNAQFLANQLDQLLTKLSAEQQKQFKRLPTESAIVCLQVKDAATVLDLGSRLKAKGVFVSAVRPPTVPISRLRMSVMATHTQKQLSDCTSALDECIREMVTTPAA